MGDKSAIEWTDATWNPVIGCTKVSDGCTNCYAIRTARRLETAFGQAAYQGLTMAHGDGSLNWTGEVRMLYDRIRQPMTWKRPRRIFVNSMSDLFHESVREEFIASVWGVMAACPQHTFQILTKRPERMHRMLTTRDFDGGILTDIQNACWQYAHLGMGMIPWPLPNVWLGVSTENQATADERIPLLLETPAAVRFISAEPLLGPLDLENVVYKPGIPDRLDVLRGIHHWRIEGQAVGYGLPGARLAWVIVGGESGGPEARRLVTHLGNQLSGEIWTPGFEAAQWVRSIRDQCQAAGVPLMFKQWGGPTPKSGGRLLDGIEHNGYPTTAVAA